ncbi:MAG: hypothetical protein ACLGHN_13990 [Bacteriovoracia bacterium]
MNLISVVLSFFITWNAFALTADEEKKYDELEGLPFLRALIQDKKYAEVIKQYPTLSKNKQELGYFHFTLAEAQFFLKNYQEAFKTLEAGSHYKNLPVEFHKLWGRTSYHLNDYRTCSDQFIKSGVESTVGDDWNILGSCLEKTNKDKLLNLVLNHRTSDFDFFLTSQKHLLKNGLRSFAEEKRRSYMSSCLPVDSYFRLWETIEAEKVLDLGVLEAAHACHPKSIELTSLLIKNLFNQGMYHSIAYIFETLATEDVMYLKHAAEFYKVAGRNTVADYFFTLGDEDGFLLAKSSHFLNKENYAGLLTIPFKQKLLEKNKDLSYALAYSQFKYLLLDSSKKILVAQVKKNTRDQQLEGLIEKVQRIRLEVQTLIHCSEVEEDFRMTFSDTLSMSIFLLPLSAEDTAPVQSGEEFFPLSPSW